MDAIKDSFGVGLCLTLKKMSLYFGQDCFFLPVKPRKRGRIGWRMFIQTIAGTTTHTIEDTSNEEDPHVYNHISNPSYNQLHKYMAI